MYNPRGALGLYCVPLQRLNYRRILVRSFFFTAETAGIKPFLLLPQYNIKKKEEQVEPVQEEPNPLMRKKKTPEELAREAEEADEDEFTSECVGSVRSLRKRCTVL